MALTFRDASYNVEEDFEYDYAASSALKISKVFRTPRQFAEIDIDQDVKGVVNTTYKVRSSCECPNAKWNTAVNVSSAGRLNGRVEVLPRAALGFEVGVEADVDVLSGSNATNEYTIFGKLIRNQFASTGSLKIPVQGSPVIEKTAAYTFHKRATGTPTVGVRAAFANAQFTALEGVLFVKSKNGWALLKIDQDRNLRLAASRVLDGATDVGFDANWSQQSPVAVMFRKYLPGGKMIKLKVNNKGRVDGVYSFGLGSALVSLNAVWGSGNPITFGARVTF